MPGLHELHTKDTVQDLKALQVELAGVVSGRGIVQEPCCASCSLHSAFAGSSRFTDGVPGHLHSAVPSYCALLFCMTIVAPWEQANNATMFAEVRYHVAPPSCLNGAAMVQNVHEPALAEVRCPAPLVKP